jgi:hypothetical protein
MIQAICDGRKTVTRRLVRGKQRVVTGDELYVKEAYQIYYGDIPIYRAETCLILEPDSWLPANSMPEDLARVRLRVNCVHLSPLASMSDEDARLEGVEGMEAFRLLWDSIYGRGAFDKNPLVRVISFERIVA